jgi:hypothetical protein
MENTKEKQVELCKDMENTEESKLDCGYYGFQFSGC